MNIVEDMHAESKSFKTRMDKFNSYMAHRSLPQDLRGDIREFLHNIRRRQKSTIKDEDYLLAQVHASSDPKLQRRARAGDSTEPMRTPLLPSLSALPRH